MRVGPVGGGPGLRLGVAVAHAVEAGAEVGVDRGPALDAQARGLPGEDGGSPLGGLAAFERGEGVGHLVDQCLRETEQARSAVGGLPAGEGDLGADATTSLPCAHTCRCLRRHLGLRERDRDPGLRRGARSLHLLEQAYLIDAFGVVDRLAQGGQPAHPRAQLRRAQQGRPELGRGRRDRRASGVRRGRGRGRGHGVILGERLFDRKYVREPGDGAAAARIGRRRRWPQGALTRRSETYKLATVKPA